MIQLALYTRKDLYIRATANFLLAFASYDKNCRCHLKKYFSKAINLPTDWIDVAEIYQYFDDNSINAHSIPTALRLAMIAKFSEFDEYQLGNMSFILIYMYIYIL